jgi:predicted outer membrane lipoprotein
MRTRWILGMLMAAALAGPAAQAQDVNETGVRTQTQERLRSGPPAIPWFDLIGALGLLGLLGLKKEHADDSYHPASVD